MNIASRCLPVGNLPYSNITSATRMLAKLFEKNPYLPFLTSISQEDTIEKRTLLGLPGVVLVDGEVVHKSNFESYKQALVVLDKAFNNPIPEFLENYSTDSVFLTKYFQLIKKFKPVNSCFNLLGPFSLSQLLKKNYDKQLLADRSYRKLIVQGVCVKAIWMIHKVREISPNTTPIIILEEPLAGQFGNIKRESEDITSETIINMYTKIVEKIKAEGALVAVQSREKCDWTIPIKAGVDIISFDAYNNPNNLCIIPDAVVEFIQRGGMINWGIVPVLTESMVKGLNISYVEKRLKATIEGLNLSGVPMDLIYKSMMVSVQGHVDHLPVIFAEKAIILATQLANRVATKAKNYSKPVEV